MADQTAPAARRTAHTYLFEVKGIQRYVFDSGLLRDVVGASDLVAGLVKSPGSASGADAGESDRDLIGQVIDKVIAAAGPAQDPQLPSRGAQAARSACIRMTRPRWTRYGRCGCWLFSCAARAWR
jgi:hypothetical protein